MSFILGVFLLAFIFLLLANGGGGLFGRPKK
jgi:hypothetical protein